MSCQKCSLSQYFSLATALASQLGVAIGISFSTTLNGGSFVPMILIEHIIEDSKKTEVKKVASDKEAQASNETFIPSK